MQVEEVAALLEEAAIAFGKDSMARARSELPDPPSGQDHEVFLYSWAFRLATSCSFLRQQRMAGVLDDQSLLNLLAFDIEVARDRLST